MSRSQKKGPFVDRHLMVKVMRAKETDDRRLIQTWSRRSVILPEFVGVNLAMGRSHAWVKRGEEYVEPRPMNWGDNLTLVGAIRRRGWVTLSTKW